MLFAFSSHPFYTIYIWLPTADDPASPTIHKKRKFWPYFKDALGALDSSHIHSSPPSNKRGASCNRKGFVSQNCLFGCLFKLKFIYALTHAKHTLPCPASILQKHFFSFFSQDLHTTPSFTIHSTSCSIRKDPMVIRPHIAYTHNEPCATLAQHFCEDLGWFALKDNKGQQKDDTLRPFVMSYTILQYSTVLPFTFATFSNLFWCF